MRTILTKNDVAFEEGYRAQEAGVPMTDNPYPPRSKERLAWYAGWERAEECGGLCNE